MTELILALDVTRGDEARSIARACAPFLDAIKIGYPLVLSSGRDAVAEIAGLGLPLIADFKVADIPNTNRLITEQAFSMGFSAVIAHAFTGKDAALACINTAHECGGRCFVVVEMSHPGGAEFFHGGVAERLARIAVECNADGIIAPATRPDRIAVMRNIVKQLPIYSPGVGVQGGDLDQVARLVDGIIVGRSIYQASDPAIAAREYSRIRR
jgi:orotidine-5'-phosphate decarboxylase